MSALYKNLILFLCLFSFTNCKNELSVNEKTNLVEFEKKDYTDKFQEAKKYCIDNRLNTDFFLLADMSIHSGKKRFFLVDFNEGIIDSFMVSHGCCNYPWSSDFTKSDPTFSNVPNSHCSSLGKYVIGERGVSNWGVRIKYLLHGKDATNSNALSRDIVFHSWEEITDEEIYPDGTAEGWGCPALSNNAFLYIDKKLQSNPKKTLLWMIG